MSGQGNVLVCTRCLKHEAMHHVGTKELCCWCYIAAGNPPADWHTVCMSEFAKK